MFEVVRGFIMTILRGGLAEQHGLLVEEDVPPPRPQPQPQVALVLGHHQERALHEELALLVQVHLECNGVVSEAAWLMNLLNINPHLSTAGYQLLYYLTS